VTISSPDNRGLHFVLRR